MEKWQCADHYGYTICKWYGNGEWKSGMQPMVGRHEAIDDRARLTHHVVRAASLEVRNVTKRKGSAVRLVRSDGRRAALDVYEALRDSILAGRIKPGAYLSQV